jgi:hypothetical protein
VAAIAAIKEKPFSFRINTSSLLVFACRSLSWLVVLPQNYGKSSTKDLRFSHDRDPAVT